MRAIPYVGTTALTGLARRTAAVRAVLVAALVALVALAVLAVRHPHASQPPFVAPSSGGMVVLDLSASITSDTYSRIHNTLQQLVARGGRYGLVVFSNTAYEALPPGTPASALAPIARYFALPATTTPGVQPTFPVNPWTNSFTSGTAISVGLDLARTVEVRSRTPHPAVVLISDLADDPSDVQQLTQELTDYRVQHVALRVIALNAAPSDQAFFSRLIGNASAIIPAQLSPPNQAAPAPTTAFPTWFAVLAVLVAALLALNELRSARLRWGEAFA